MAEKLYYIQNRGYLGNGMIWWREGGRGYTSNIEEAGRFPAEEMLSIINNRPNDDFAWECDYIDNTPEIRKVFIDTQYIDYDKRIMAK
jgi:hypothetical protein